MTKYLEGGRTTSSSDTVKISSLTRTTPFSLSSEIIRKQLSHPTSDAIARLPRVRITFTSSEVSTSHQGASAPDTFGQRCIDRLSDLHLRRGRWIASAVEQEPRSEDPSTSVPLALKRQTTLFRGRWIERQQPDPISPGDKSTRIEPVASSAQRTFNEILHLAHEQIVTDSRSTIHTTTSGLTIVEREPPKQARTHTDAPDVLASIRPSEELQAAYQFLADKVLPVFADQFSVESPREQLDARVAELVQDAELYTRISPENLARALQDGRLKSQQETRSSGGMLNLHLRKRMERHLFNYPLEDLDPKLRPVYGHPATHPYGYVSSIHSHYGSSLLLWDEQVKARTTFMLGDSLNLGRGTYSRGYVRALPVPFNKPDMRALDITQLLHRNPLQWRSLFDLPSYAEIQIHGGASLHHDVKAIIFRNPTEMLSHPAALKQASRYDIPCFFDFSHKSDLPLQITLDPLWKALSDFGYTIKTDTPSATFHRQYAQVLDPLGLQGRHQDLKHTRVQIFKQ